MRRLAWKGPPAPTEGNAAPASNGIFRLQLRLLVSRVYAAIGIPPEVRLVVGDSELLHDPPTVGLVTSGLGFWLPCGRANFFTNADLPILHPPRASMGANARARLAERLSNFSAIAEGLEGSVFRRLSVVLGSRNFSAPIPVYPASRRRYLEDAHPDAAVFVHEGSPSLELNLCRLEQDVLLTEHGRLRQWEVGATVERLILIVTADGFYVLLAQHYVSEQLVEEALQVFAEALVGGPFYSHFSGRETDDAPSSMGERQSSLRHYRDDKLGILNFFQLNTILEGMFSSTFDPYIFFHERSQVTVEHHTLEEHRKRYSLQNFLARIYTRFRVDADDQHARPCQMIAQAAPHIPIAERVTWATTLRDAALTMHTKQEILRRFLIGANENTLLPLKWRIERTRRALLGEMIEVTHRREPLIQLESPDEHDEHITHVNESQLRGYVMLVSSKLPIIANVGRYLNEVIRSMESEAEGDAITSHAQQWNGLLSATTDNILSLERAIEQARLDRLLYEETQIRAEQETAAEISRVRERSGRGLVGTSSSGGTDAVVSVLLTYAGVLVAAFAAAFAAMQVAQNGQFPELQRLLEGAALFLNNVRLSATQALQTNDLPTELAFSLRISALVAAPIVFVYVLAHAARVWGQRASERWFGGGHPHYIEMTARLDAPIGDRLLAAGFFDHRSAVLGDDDLAC